MKETVRMISDSSLIPEEKIASKILLIRGDKVLLDVHLAELYGVETRVLKQAVRRNRDRFPEDFMYELTENEIEAVVSQNVIPHKKHFGGATPFAFTEAGVAMLSSVIKSTRAVNVNIAIMRTFVNLRKLAMNYDELFQKLENLEKDYGEKFTIVFNALERLFKTETEPRKSIGYKKGG